MQQEIRRFLLEHAQRWPRLEAGDLIKALYQSAFGCGHFAPGEEQVLAYLSSELETTQASADGEMVEPLLRGYCRVHIKPYAAKDMRKETLARLFMLTANESPDEQARAWFEDALDQIAALAQGGQLPFDVWQVQAHLDAYRAAGCPSVHHSPAFAAAYHPAYRVLRSDYAQLLPVFAAIDRQLKNKECVIVAVDGNSGAGKSSLAALLAAVYDGTTVVHMDDFFLQMHQRTPERFAQPGGNVDHERFLDEVLRPMRAGEAFVYRPFDCAGMEIGEGRRMRPGKLCIVEGSYSLHPQLEKAYDLKILLTIPPAAQVERILRRNGEWMLRRFVGEWIPMENLYFEKTEIAGRCDLEIGVTPLEGGRTNYRVKETEGCA